MLHYLADGVFDPTVRADLSPSLMLSLAGTRARFQRCVIHTHTHRHARVHTVHAHTDYVLIMIFYVRVRKLIITCLFPRSYCAGLVMATKQIFFSSESSQIQTSASAVFLILCHYCFFSLQREQQRLLASSNFTDLEQRQKRIR